MLKSVIYLYSADLRNWFGISNIDSNSSIIRMTRSDTNQNISWFVDTAILKDLAINMKELVNIDVSINVYGNVQHDTRYRFIIIKHIDRYTLILSETNSHINILEFDVSKNNFVDLLRYIQSLLGE